MILRIPLLRWLFSINIETKVNLFLIELKELNLASNSISFLNENCFFNLVNLNNLKLSSNQINSTDFLKSNEIFLSLNEIVRDTY